MRHDFARAQPLAGEVHDQTLRLRVGEHAIDGCQSTSAFRQATHPKRHRARRRRAHCSRESPTSAMRARTNRGDDPRSTRNRDRARCGRETPRSKAASCSTSVNAAGSSSPSSRARFIHAPVGLPAPRGRGVAAPAAARPLSMLEVTHTGSGWIRGRRSGRRELSDAMTSVARPLRGVEVALDLCPRRRRGPTRCYRSPRAPAAPATVRGLETGAQDVLSPSRCTRSS